MIQIKASNRLKLMASNKSVVADLKSVGFALSGFEDGVWTIPKLNEAKVKAMCDKLIKTKGYKSQGASLYPSEDGFHLVKDDDLICVDPDGYVYLS